jgi:hypothetical protein
VLYGEDFDGVAEVMEADAVVADAEPELGRVDVLEALHVAFAGSNKTSQSVKDAEGGGLVDGPELGLGLVCPDDLPGHVYWPAPWGSSGVRPMRSKSSWVSPNSARISS